MDDEWFSLSGGVDVVGPKKKYLSSLRRFYFGRNPLIHYSAIEPIFLVI